MTDSRFAVLFACTALFVSSAFSQTVSGIISGTVVDSSDLAVVGARVSLINEETGYRIASKTDGAGAFLFNSVLPGRYTVAIEASGFKRLEQRNLNLTPSARLPLGRLSLEVGAVVESVTVEAQGAAVEIESNDRSSLLTGDQMRTMMSRGGNVPNLLISLPGAVPASESEFERDFFGTAQTPSFGGTSNQTNSISIDGLNSNDVSNPNYLISPVNLEAIAEVKVLLNNYKAEYGRNGGAVITAVSKGGAKQFHGSAYYQQRNEALNANNYFNNLNGVARPRYRFRSFGFTMGGPVFWPGKFNSHKDKLFFFYSEDVNRVKVPVALVQQTMPTALERTGDYSQTVDLNGNRVSILDPLAARTAFPGNIIPKNRLDANGQTLLNIMPVPNFFDIGISRRNYNYNFQESQKRDTRQELLRLDYNATSKLRLFFRGTTFVENWGGYNVAGNAAWPMLKTVLNTKNPGITTTITYTASATIISETSIGLSGTREEMFPQDAADFSALSRSKLGFTLPQIYPSNNPLNLIPWTTFGGITNAARVVVRSDFPDRLWGSRIPFTETLTKVAGPHTLKAGLYAERARMYRRANATFAGAFDFSRDSNNPFDSNWAYSNALIGTFRTYTESDSRPNWDPRGTTIEWYVQDTWKATRRLTLDYGLRFTRFTPYAQANGIGANFVASNYDPAKRVVLYMPALNAQKSRVAVNPLTGELASVSLIGAIVPNSGNVRNGMIYAGDPGVPQGFIENRGLHLGPRAGFAYDLFGNGRTALRGGFGITYQTHSNGGSVTPTVDNMQNTPTIFNSTFSSMNPNAGVLFPRTVSALNQYIKAPTFFNYSFGVQRMVGRATLVDVAYVANLGRQLTQTQQLNTLPYGMRFLPSSVDTTTNRPLADDYLRPFLGYTNVSIPRTASSSYHSLQTQANRRFARGMQFSISWTWAKSMGYVGTFPTYLDNHLNYGKTSLDRTHSVSINWLYDLPRASKLWNVAPMRLALDGWQVSGLALFQSGRPWTVSYSLVSGTDLSGGGDWTRAVMLHAATLSHGERTSSRFFDTSAFAPPAKGEIGNAPVDLFRGPGRNNWDISLFKSFKVEKASIQFRWEMYNAFNHTSFYSVDNGARFDAAGNQVNTRFGAVTAALAPRVMKGSLRISF